MKHGTVICIAGARTWEDVDKPRRKQKEGVGGGPAQALDEDLVETFAEMFGRTTAEEEEEKEEEEEEEKEDEGTKEHGEVGENGRAQDELACGELAFGEGQLYITQGAHVSRAGDS